MAKGISIHNDGIRLGITVHIRVLRGSSGTNKLCCGVIGLIHRGNIVIPTSVLLPPGLKLAATMGTFSASKRGWSSAAFNILAVLKIA